MGIYVHHVSKLKMPNLQGLTLMGLLESQMIDSDR